ncbi:cell wall-active antibiotics response protein LiaF [Enterococcus hirae]|jgi:predicted membrane protein|nr:cell wall-active antibiotics response protein LiaF [Enterococcaceae bacterium]MCI1918793.1 cell wall-active antibiotics response protein LiaF [Enterococcaceae bacterium]MDM8214507.1 cell wall-active antibiotics response protein LiaF [Enterococcus hirae]
MSASWRFFLVVEAILAVFALVLMYKEAWLLFLLFLGIFCLYAAWKKKRRNSTRDLLLMSGGVILLITALNSPVIIGMIIFAIIFIGVKGVEISGVQLLKGNSWQKKKLERVETISPLPKDGKRMKRPLFGSERIGDEAYEWNDINMVYFSGDTIIDLGNTILPQKESLIMIRKCFGKTRVLVPTGISLLLEHATVLGEVHFEGEEYSLKTESLRLYSEDYDQNPRKLRIATSTLFGDLEVIRV